MTWFIYLLYNLEAWNNLLLPWDSQKIKFFFFFFTFFMDDFTILCLNTSIIEQLHG